MIKYLREKFTSQSVDDENLLSIQKTHSQNNFNDLMSISINSNDDQRRNEVEKLTAAAGGHRLINSSSPIIIPKKATYSNTPSHSSSSYTSITDHMSSSGEILFQSHRDSDHAAYTSLPMLPSMCEKLEHSAARDRILVKNKRRQAMKDKLTTLKETEDNQIDLFSSTPPDDESEIVELPTETNTPSQPLVELADLDAARSRLRARIRPRDHSADQILQTPHVPSVQRSVSYKRPQEMNETKLLHRSIYRNIEGESKKSSEEHIYDNLDVFKQNKMNIKSDHDSSSSDAAKTREHPVIRLRPVTMHIPATNENQATSEFENVFNQLKKRVSIKKVHPQAEVKPVVEETVQPPVPAIMVEETPVKEPMVPVVAPTTKVPTTSSVSQPPNRRKTVGGVHLPGTNKVAVDDSKPTPSWIDIAKQKQSKFQSVADERDVQEEETKSVEPVIVSRTKETKSAEPVIVSRTKEAKSVEPVIVSKMKETTSEETHSDRKVVYEPTVTRRRSPATSQVPERDSIRALKAGNPNRINNLIQLFDK